MPLIIQNFVLFQLGWFCCVLSGANHLPSLAGIAAVAIIVTIHLLRATNSGNEAMLILMTMIIGTLWDSTLMMAGVFTFSSAPLTGVLAPLWLIVMWALFATTLNVSLNWLKGRYWLAAILGATGGPLAYFAGHRLGAVAFSDTTIAMLLVAAGWAIIMPVLVALSNRYNGYTGRRHTLQEAEAL
ncbi:MAG: DUF2878 domain-containing protein [Arenicellales bacterium]